MKTTAALFILALSLNSLAQDCVEMKSTVLSTFVQLNFDDRISVGSDQFIPVKEQILEFTITNPKTVITDINLTLKNSKAPTKFSKIPDPSAAKILENSTNERGVFAAKALMDLKKMRPELASVHYTTKSIPAGPEYTAQEDANTRFVTKMTTGYEQRVCAMYDANRALFDEAKFITSSDELLNAERFPNLFQSKFKPFHGVQITIQGYVKCKEQKDKPKAPSSPSSRIQ